MCATTTSAASESNFGTFLCHIVQKLLVNAVLPTLIIILCTSQTYIFSTIHFIQSWQHCLTHFIRRRSSSSLSNFNIIHKLRKSTTINHSFSVYRFLVRESERLCCIIALSKDICMTLYPNPRYAPTSCHQYKKASNIIDGDEYCHFFCQYLFF